LQDQQQKFAAIKFCQKTFKVSKARSIRHRLFRCLTTLSGWRCRQHAH
jgi:hypothetical protein